MLLGKGLAAAASIPGNIAQGVAGIVLGMALAVALQKIRFSEKAGLAA